MIPLLLGGGGGVIVVVVVVVMVPVEYLGYDVSCLTNFYFYTILCFVSGDPESLSSWNQHRCLLSGTFLSHNVSHLGADC